jgi:hypothetical protein
VQASIGQRTGVVLAIALALVFGRELDATPFRTAIGAERVLPTAVTVMTIGIMVMVTHRQALTQIVGFLMIENGMALAACRSSSSWVYSSISCSRCSWRLSTAGVCTRSSARWTRAGWGR